MFYIIWSHDEYSCVVLLAFFNNLRLQKNFSPIIPLGRIGLHYYPVHHALISSKIQLHHPGNPRSFDRRVCPREWGFWTLPGWSGAFEPEVSSLWSIIHVFYCKSLKVKSLLSWAIGFERQLSHLRTIKTRKKPMSSTKN